MMYCTLVKVHECEFDFVVGDDSNDFWFSSPPFFHTYGRLFSLLHFCVWKINDCYRLNKSQINGIDIVSTNTSTIGCAETRTTIP